MFKYILLILLSLQSCSRFVRKETITLTPKNIVNLRGEISDQSVSQTLSKLLPMLDNSDRTIYLVLNSPGGSVSAGLDFIEAVRPYKNLKVICLYCASMAYMILQAVENDRIVTQSSILMSHRASLGGLGGQINDGELESRLNFIRFMINTLEQKVADRVGLTLEEYKDKIKDEWYLFGTQAITERNADVQATLQCSQQLLETYDTISQTVYFIGIPIGTKKSLISACPFLTETKELPSEEENKQTEKQKD